MESVTLGLWVYLNCTLTVDGLSTVAGRVVEKVAPHVKKHGPKLVPESMKKKNDGRPSNMDGAKHVAVSGVKGI